MKYYDDFKISGESFAEKIGEAREDDAAIGKIAINFSDLEDTVSNIIHLLLGTYINISRIVTAELSFRIKLDLLSSLLIYKLPQLNRDNEIDIEIEQIRELILVCKKANDLRNTYIHSSYSWNKRKKVTAKSRHGLREQTEKINSDILLDVADYIGYAAIKVEEFPVELGIADLIRGQGDSIIYYKNSKIVADLKIGGI